ncbi:MAG: hypothetical protein P8Z37_02555 [Acidobacteriota bacterium]
MKRQGSQLRKSLFYGLTLVLVSVFIYLAVQGNRLEKERTAKGTDVVETFEPTPVRALAPMDLEITAASISPDAKTMKPDTSVVRHKIDIRNSGDVVYSELQLELDYLDAAGVQIGSLLQQVKKEVPPGNTRLSIDIPRDKIPADTLGIHPKVVYADIESAD